MLSQKRPSLNAARASRPSRVKPSRSSSLQLRSLKAYTSASIRAASGAACHAYGRNAATAADPMPAPQNARPSLCVLMQACERGSSRLRKPPRTHARATMHATHAAPRAPETQLHSKALNVRAPRHPDAADDAGCVVHDRQLQRRRARRCRRHAARDPRVRGCLSERVRPAVAATGPHLSDAAAGKEGACRGDWWRSAAAEAVRRLLLPPRAPPYLQSAC